MLSIASCSPVRARVPYGTSARTGEHVPTRSYVRGGKQRIVPYHRTFTICVVYYFLFFCNYIVYFTLIIVVKKIAVHVQKSAKKGKKARVSTFNLNKVSLRRHGMRKFLILCTHLQNLVWHANSK